MAGELRLALLIDADNVTPRVAAHLIAEVSKLGSAAVRRVYGDWGKPSVGAWRECALAHSLQPVQQIAYVPGKNATDIAMVIDAMDLLYSGRFDGFCLVSSDSDFTRLALRIREQGLKVFGFGAFTTPPPFVGACDRFVFLCPPEEVSKVVEVKKPPVEKPKVPPATTTKPLDKKILSVLKHAVATSADASGWSTLAETGVWFRKQIPDFNVSEYGFSQFGKMVEATGTYEVDRSLKDRKVIMVRPKIVG